MKRKDISLPRTVQGPVGVGQVVVIDAGSSHTSTVLYDLVWEEQTQGTALVTPREECYLVRRLQEVA